MQNLHGEGLLHGLLDGSEEMQLDHWEIIDSYPMSKIHGKLRGNIHGKLEKNMGRSWNIHVRTIYSPDIAQIFTIMNPIFELQKYQILEHAHISGPVPAWEIAVQAPPGHGDSDRRTTVRLQWFWIYDEKR